MVLLKKIDFIFEVDLFNFAININIAPIKIRGSANFHFNCVFSINIDNKTGEKAINKPM
jgi:hypothetical protein